MALYDERMFTFALQDLEDAHIFKVEVDFSRCRVHSDHHKTPVKQTQKDTDAATVEAQEHRLGEADATTASSKVDLEDRFVTQDFYKKMPRLKQQYYARVPQTLEEAIQACALEMRLPHAASVPHDM